MSDRQPQNVSISRNLPGKNRDYRTGTESKSNSSNTTTTTYVNIPNAFDGKPQVLQVTNDGMKDGRINLITISGGDDYADSADSSTPSAEFYLENGKIYMAIYNPKLIDYFSEYPDLTKIEIKGLEIDKKLDIRVKGVADNLGVLFSAFGFQKITDSANNIKKNEKAPFNISINEEFLNKAIENELSREKSPDGCLLGNNMNLDSLTLQGLLRMISVNETNEEMKSDKSFADGKVKLATRALKFKTYDKKTEWRPMEFMEINDEKYVYLSIVEDNSNRLTREHAGRYYKLSDVNITPDGRMLLGIKDKSLQTIDAANPNLRTVEIPIDTNDPEIAKENKEFVKFVKKFYGEDKVGDKDIPTTAKISTRTYGKREGAYNYDSAGFVRKVEDVFVPGENTPPPPEPAPTEPEDELGKLKLEDFIKDEKSAERAAKGGMALFAGSALFVAISIFFPPAQFLAYAFAGAGSVMMTKPWEIFTLGANDAINYRNVGKIKEYGRERARFLSPHAAASHSRSATPPSASATATGATPPSATPPGAAAIPGTTGATSATATGSAGTGGTSSTTATGAEATPGAAETEAAATPGATGAEAANPEHPSSDDSTSKYSAPPSDSSEENNNGKNFNEVMLEDTIQSYKHYYNLLAMQIKIIDRENPEYIEFNGENVTPEELVQILSDQIIKSKKDLKNAKAREQRASAKSVESFKELNEYVTEKKTSSNEKEPTNDENKDDPYKVIIQLTNSIETWKEELKSDNLPEEEKAKLNEQIKGANEKLSAFEENIPLYAYQIINGIRGWDAKLKSADISDEDRAKLKEQKEQAKICLSSLEERYPDTMEKLYDLRNKHHDAFQAYIEKYHETEIIKNKLQNTETLLNVTKYTVNLKKLIKNREDAKAENIQNEEKETAENHEEQEKTAKGKRKKEENKNKRNRNSTNPYANNANNFTTYKDADIVSANSTTLSVIMETSELINKQQSYLNEVAKMSKQEAGLIEQIIAAAKQKLSLTGTQTELGSADKSTDKSADKSNQAASTSTPPTPSKTDHGLN